MTYTLISIIINDVLGRRRYQNIGSESRSGYDCRNSFQVREIRLKPPLTYSNMFLLGAVFLVVKSVVFQSVWNC
jgi:hypothetical protein